MLNLRVVRKFHDNKGLLYAYRVKDLNTGEEMNVHKDELKNAVARGAVYVDNMTLTSDGRLIGHATPKDRPVARANRQMINPNRTGCKLVEVYTNGRKISGGLVDQTENYRMQGKEPKALKGLQLGFGFEPGTDISSRIKNGTYDNVKIVEGKPDMEGTKRKSFKAIKPKMIKMLNDNGISTTISVSKGEEKYEYRVVIDIETFNRINDNIDNDEAIQAILCLIEDAMISSNIKPLYIDENTLFVSCMTGINDVRKALKSAEIAKI